VRQLFSKSIYTTKDRNCPPNANQQPFFSKYKHRHFHPMVNPPTSPPQSNPSHTEAVSKGYCWKWSTIGPKRVTGSCSQHHATECVCGFALFLNSPANNDTDTEVLPFPDADPYLSEVQVFLTVVRSGDPSLVRSSYRDAANTYRLSWDIRRASEMKQS